MKRSVLLILWICPILLLAQKPAEWGAFNQVVDGKSIAGKKFKLEAAVKLQAIDPLAEAEIWVRVDRTNKKTGFFYNMKDKPIRSSEWVNVSIEGKIDKDAEQFWFGGLYGKKAVFYFDNFRLQVETNKGHYEDVLLFNRGFEEDSLRPNWHYYQGKDGFSLSITKEEAYEGHQSFKVDGSHFKKINTYGDNDSTGKYINANGIKLYYEEYGSGAPLLLLHGNSESIASFRLQIPELSKYYRVIAVDSRGQGKSSEDGRTYSYDLFAEDMTAFLDVLHLDSVLILGWSDGGNTGLIMAMKYPRKVKQLVTMGANVFIDNSVVGKSVFKELNKQMKELDGDTTYNSKNRIRMINMLLTEPQHKFEELKTISCPVLVLAGEKDVIKEEHTKGIAANIPHSTLLIAPKQTHYYPWEDPTSFNKTVLDYLKTIQR